jgi:hypothetical protein
MIPNLRSNGGSLDYDLSGVLSLRVEGAQPSDLAAMEQWLPAPAACPADGPDLTIRFVDWRGDPAGSPGSAGAFPVVSGGRSSARRLAVPFGALGREPCTIVCEHGRTPIPLLGPLLGLVALGKGFAPLHASALVWRERGVLLSGFSTAGKTGALLAFLARGASLVGDDWLAINPATDSMHGAPFRIAVRTRYLATWPSFGLGVAMAERIRGRLPGSSRVRMDPRRVLGEPRCPGRGPLHAVFLLLPDDVPAFSIQRSSEDATVRRLGWVCEMEWQELTAQYHRFRFAHPEACNPLIDQREWRIRTLLTRALRGKALYTVARPRSAPPDAWFDALGPLLQRAAA